METEATFYTPSRAARELGVSVDTLKRWETTTPPQIKATRTLGGHRRYAVTEVERIKNRNTTQQASE